jgi:diacylglycerol kinase family enzyme
VIVRADAEARTVVARARRGHQTVPALGLTGGDLWRTLGAPSPGPGPGAEARLRSAEAHTFTCDLGSVLIDGKLHWFVAHLIARRGWWQGRTIAVMNAQWLGRWDLGPRSHPDDGLLDIADADLSFGDRLKARHRLPTGTHVPHPDIATFRRASMIFDLAPGLDIWLDGEKVDWATHLAVRVEPDALTVVV